MRRASTPLFSQPNMFPFLGVNIVLLLIFMVITPPPPHGVLIELAKVKHSRYLRGANRADAVVLVVMRDGKVYFETEQVWPDQIAAKLMPLSERARYDWSAGTRLYIKVDARTRYKMVKDVLDRAPANVAQRVSFVTD